MKLELKHLSPYLPYGLKVHNGNHAQTMTKCYNDPFVMIEITGYGMGQRFTMNPDKVKPIWKPVLRPLSDLMKHEYINTFWQKDSFLDEITESDNQLEKATHFINRFRITDNDYCYPYDFFSKLFENHFDVFGLIPAGLAIDINTLK